jgi:VanZ family protein
VARAALLLTTTMPGMPRASGSKIIPWLLMGVVALIAYGSLYPFDFKSDPIQGGVLAALSQLSWARAGRGDRISNVLLYLPLGFCLFLWLNTRWRRPASLLFATLLGTLFSFAIELAQVYVSARVPSLTDLSLNALGTVIGAMGGLAWRIGTLWMHLPQRVEKPARDSTAGLLIALWVLWRFAPFIPHFDLGKLKAALRPLFDPQLNPALVFAYLTCWIVISQALASIVSRARLLETLLVLIAFVLVGRLLVADQAFVPSELVALVMLLPVLVVTDRLTLGPRRTLLVLSILLVFLGYRLAPFEFTAPASTFDFWPFLAWFDAGLSEALQTIDWSIVFGQVFLYAAVLWCVKQCGTSMSLASISMLMLTLATEIVQLWLPGQTGSIADLAIALAVALAFVYADRRATRVPQVARATPRFGRNP